MNDVTKNILIWIVIVIVMLAVFHRYMPTAPSTALSKDLKFNRVPRAPQTCLTTTAGSVICPPPNGSIGADAAGQAVCGRGECSKDERVNGCVRLGVAVMWHITVRGRLSALEDAKWRLRLSARPP